MDPSVVRGLLHELRTPLNVLVGYADLLDDGTLPSGAQQRVARIQGAAGRLTGLLDLAADLARALQGLVPATPVSPSAALAMAVAAVEGDATARRITLEHAGAGSGPDAVTGAVSSPEHAPVPLAARTLTCALIHAVHRSPGGAVVRARAEGREVVIESTAEITDPAGPPPPGQAGQRFWLEATALLADALGARLAVEHPGTPGWRARVLLPATS
jgi:hypothetical protein